jgi:hypothetical protein
VPIFIGRGAPRNPAIPQLIVASSRNFIFAPSQPMRVFHGC